MAQHCQRRAPLQSGFTLLEVVIALAVLGLVVVMISAGIRFGLASWRAQTAAASQVAELDSIDRLFRTLITGIDAGKTPPLLGSPDSISLQTLLPNAVAQGQRYAAVTVKVTSDHGLALLWQPVDQTGAKPPTVTPLLDGVTAVEFGYLPSLSDNSSAWRTTWEDGLPELIRIRIKFAAKDLRHWPDILVAPIIKPAEK